MHQRKYLRILEGIGWDALLFAAMGVIYAFVRIASNDLAFMLEGFPLLSESSSITEVAVSGQIANEMLKKLILLWIIAALLFFVAWVIIKYALYMRLNKKKWSTQTLRVFAVQTIIYWLGLGVLFVVFRVVLLPFYDTFAYPINFIVYFMGLLVIVLTTFILGTPFLLSNQQTIRKTFKEYEKIRLIKPQTHWWTIGGLIITNIAGYITTTAGLGQAPSNLFLIIYLSWMRVHYAQAMSNISTKKHSKRKKK